MSHDILLCNPPVGQVNYPYIAIPLLKSLLQRSGYRVAVSDANIKYFNYARARGEGLGKEANRLNSAYLSSNPSGIDPGFTRDWVRAILPLSSVFGFSVVSPQSLPWSISAASEIKQQNPEAMVVLGGAFFDTVSAHHVLSKNSSIDAVVFGEGEATLLEILSRNVQRKHLARVQGLAARSWDGSINVNPKHEFVKDLDALPFADFSCLPLGDYLNWRTGLRVLPILGSRSCIGKCSFCSEKARWGRYRPRTPGNILSEIEYQVKKHRVEMLRFNDSLINGDQARLEHLCELMIEARLKVEWVGNARVSRRMSDRLLQKMFQAGCRVLWFGVESGSPKILENMKKGIDIKEVPEVFQRVRKAGISVLTFWITNFPMEQMEDTRHTLDFFRNHGRHIDFAHFSEFHLHKQSEMYNHPDQFGISIQGLNEIGNPLWRYCPEPFRNDEILKSVAPMYTNQPRLPWDFVGMM
ncbi:MAG: B12-binding domain-containing radical SAM protein [Desulfohalobiaceae bacterium]|nr:B12-binding domain-containing radical SAM protein [Desulfohalobiaceae bacterium]